MTPTTLAIERVPGAIAAGFCGYEYTRPFKRVCEAAIGHHPTTLPRTRTAPLIDDHEFVPTYYVPVDEPRPDGLVVPLTGRLRPVVRAAIRDAIKPQRRESRGSRIEVMNPERGHTLDWVRLDNFRLPRVAPYALGPFRLRVRRVVQVGMFHTSRMQPSGAERMATCWPDGTVTLDERDDDDEREEAD